MASSRQLPLDYNESTYAASGADYSSLAVWESATDNNLITATKGEVLTCAEGIYNDFVQIQSAAADADYFRVLRGAVGTASPTSGVRFVRATTANSTNIYLVENFAQVHDIAVKVTTASSNISTVCFGALRNENKFVGCVAYDSNGTGTGYGIGFYLSLGDANYSAYAINCVAKNITNGSSEFGGAFTLKTAGGGVVTNYIDLYNCTAVSSTVGINVYQLSGILISLVKNVVSEGNTTNWSETNATATRTTCTDGSGVTFDADGYHLASNDTVAIGNGTDLSATFTDDIDGETRDDWDIGADEYISAGTTAVPLRMLMGAGS